MMKKAVPREKKLWASLYSLMNRYHPAGPMHLMRYFSLWKKFNNSLFLDDMDFNVVTSVNPMLLIAGIDQNYLVEWCENANNVKDIG